MPADPAIPAAKVEAVARALCDHVNHAGDYDENADLRGPGWRPAALAALRAAAAYDAEQGAAAGPQPARERDTDAWWAD